MEQRFIQTQEQKLQQVQRLSQQQMLQVHLLEMPLTELEENVNAELDDNPALEVSSTEDALDNPHDRDTDDRSRDDYGSTDSKAEGRDGDDDNGTDIVSDEFDRQNEREERESALNAALERIGEGDDDMPTASYQYGGNNESADYEEMVYGNTTSFYDRLKEQMGELELTETDRDIMEYVIGSLDSDGLLRKDSESISDELAIYHGIDCTTADVERIVGILQTSDPAGIGAHTLQECLLLQIDRRNDDELKPLMKKVVTTLFDDFTKKHFDRIKTALNTDSYTAKRVIDEIRRLNPKPEPRLARPKAATYNR